MENSSTATMCLPGMVGTEKAKIGTWWWALHGIFEKSHDITPEKALDLLIQNHVSEIYLDVSGMYPDGEKDFDPLAASFSCVRHFIRLCNTLGIRVSALTGASRERCKTWIDPTRGYPEIQSFLNKIEFFNALAEPDERFTAVHVDVEPHSIKGFQENRSLYFSQYALLMEYICKRAHQAGLQSETDICADFRETDVVNVNGEEKKLLDAAFDSCDTIVVMAYRHSAERQMEFGTSRYIPYAEKYNTRLMVGCETLPPCDDLSIDDIPPSITYSTVGWETMVEEQKKLQNILQKTTTADFGISVHHVHSWEKLVSGDGYIRK